MLPALYNNHYEIVQTPDAVMIMTEEIHDTRIIRINAQHLPANVSQWFGDSIGHWEGDTLVVETTNYTPQTRFRGSSKDLKVTERFTRPDERSILYKATMEDASTWTRPWTLELRPDRSMNTRATRAITRLKTFWADCARWRRKPLPARSSCWIRLPAGPPGASPSGGRNTSYWMTPGFSTIRFPCVSSGRKLRRLFNPEDCCVGSG